MADFRVLFVCVGNVCRSPMGERLLRLRVPDQGFVVESAGIAALVGEPMSAEAVPELEARGGSADGFVARLLSETMVRESDLILTATLELRSRVLSDVPSALRRTFTVREFAELVDLVDGVDLRGLVAAAGAARSRARVADYDVPDPYRRGPEAHALSATLMSDAVDRIAIALSKYPAA